MDRGSAASRAHDSEDGRASSAARGSHPGPPWSLAGPPGPGWPAPCARAFGRGLATQRVRAVPDGRAAPGGPAARPESIRACRCVPRPVESRPRRRGCEEEGFRRSGVLAGRALRAAMCAMATDLRRHRAPRRGAARRGRQDWSADRSDVGEPGGRARPHVRPRQHGRRRRRE